MVCLLRRWFWCWLILLLSAGCTRTHYRLRADRETFAILGEKAACTPWRLPADFSVRPHPRSRFFDPTPVDDPLLPCPAPRLYAYQLPEMKPRDPARFRRTGDAPRPFALAGADVQRLPAVAAA